MSRWYDPFGVASSTYHAVTGAPTAQEKRAQANAVNAQVNAYKEQTRMAQEEINAKRGEMAVEKRRVQEKQIRSLRRSFRPAGFLNTGGDINNTLGS